MVHFDGAIVADSILHLMVHLVENFSLQLMVH